MRPTVKTAAEVKKKRARATSGARPAAAVRTKKMGKTQHRRHERGFAMYIAQALLGRPSLGGPGRGAHPAPLQSSRRW
jgi:hypothetical protein